MRKKLAVILFITFLIPVANLQPLYYSSTISKTVIAKTIPQLPVPSAVPTAVINKGTSEQVAILSGINEYRRAKGLPAVQPDGYTCAFAAVRAAEIAGNFSHDGFTSRINNRTLPYPGYHEVTENLAETDNYKNVVNMWINSPGHAANMEKDTPYVCVVVDGKYFAYEGWKP